MRATELVAAVKNLLGRTMVFGWLRERVRIRTKQKIDKFCQDHTPQADLDFLADCGISENTEAARIALGVRRAVAKCGCIEPAFVATNDDYPGSLEVLPFWDSIDVFGFLLELENEIGVRLSKKDITQIFNFNETRRKGGTVKDWVNGTIAVLSCRKTRPG